MKQISIQIPYPSETDTERPIILSEVFRGMQYERKGSALIIYTQKNGVLAIPLCHAELWADEIKAIADCWKGAT